MKTAIIIGSLLLGAGIATSGYFVSNIMYKSHTAVNTAEVKGLAERRVKANVGDIRIDFVVRKTDSINTIPAMYAEVERQQKVIIDTIKKAGFSDEDINEGTPQYSKQVYRDDNGTITSTEENIYTSVFMETSKVDELQALKPKISALLVDGIEVENIYSNLRFTNLNEIKPEMVKEATKNARLAAEEFANYAGVKVGSIRSALQGGFSITDVGEEYGDTQKMNKDVRVVTTIEFYLEDE
jgi:uncharacterized protein